VYLTLVLDVLTLRELIHKVALTLEEDYAAEIINEAMSNLGAPEIVITNQASKAKHGRSRGL